MPESQVLKIRQGKTGGGKGALVGKEVSFTLATSQDQTLFQWIEGDNDGDAEEARPIQDVQAMRKANASEEDAERQARVDARLQETAILQSKMHGSILRGTNEDGHAVMDDSSLPCEEDLSSRTVRSLRQGRSDGRSSQKRQLAGQLAREPDARLQELPQQTAPPEGSLQDMRQADEGSRVLREALPEVQEIRESTNDGLRNKAIDEEAGGQYVVRRLTPV